MAVYGRLSGYVYKEAAMQDEVRDKSVAFVIHAGKDGMKMTSQLLKWAIIQYQKRNAPHGKENLKRLVKQGDTVQNIEITNKNIKSFERCARKYGVRFSLKKVPEQGKYLVFFRAKDADVLDAAFAEYTAKTLNRDRKRPSLKKSLAHFKQISQKLETGKEKNLRKGEIER